MMRPLLTARRLRNLRRRPKKLARVLGISPRACRALVQSPPPPPKPKPLTPQCGRCGDDLEPEVLGTLRCETCRHTEALLEQVSENVEQVRQRRQERRQHCMSCGKKLPARAVREGMRLCAICRQRGGETAWEDVA